MNPYDWIDEGGGLLVPVVMGMIYFIHMGIKKLREWFAADNEAEYQFPESDSLSDEEFADMVAAGFREEALLARKSEGALMLARKLLDKIKAQEAEESLDALRQWQTDKANARSAYRKNLRTDRNE